MAVRSMLSLSQQEQPVKVWLAWLGTLHPIPLLAILLDCGEDEETARRHHEHENDRRHDSVEGSHATNGIMGFP
jgi:hypothetical protein